MKFGRSKNVIHLPDRSASAKSDARSDTKRHIGPYHPANIVKTICKAHQLPASRRFSVREKLLTLALFAVSTFSVMQIATAQNGAESPETPRYSDARELWSERSQDNFPGSAFYFLDESNSAWIDPAIAGNGDRARLQDAADSLNNVVAGQNTAASAQFGVGATAKKFLLSGAENSKYRAQQCLTTAIYYEAAQEPDEGQRAVAQVILNRVVHPSYPKSVCGVVYQGSERSTGCQFSFTCDGSLRRKPSSFYWSRARKVATAMLAGEVSIPAGLATHYHTIDIRPYWAPSLNFIGAIGNHRFYKWKGAAGKKNAFSQNYAGYEPQPGPYARKKSTGNYSATDPVALAKSYEQAIARSNTAQNAAPSAASSTASANQKPDSSSTTRQRSISAQTPVRDDAIGQAASSGDILPKYRQSGQWIDQPSN